MIIINKISDAKKLHCHYDRQTNAQDIYVELDCRNETLGVNYNGEIGNAVPFSVYHGHEQRFGIPLLTTDATNSLLDEIAPIAERVAAGYASVWDGNNNVARFNDDAQEAIEEIGALCDAAFENADESDIISEWNAGDWLANTTYYRDENKKQCKWNSMVSAEIEGFGTITADTTDDEISAMTDEIDADADSNNIIITGVDKYLTDIRDNCKENAEE